jgi:hypothetical protein
MMKLVDIVKSAPAVKGGRVPFDQIDISIHHRPTHADKVVELVRSIRTLGLQAAPVVIEREGRFKLVSGRHRLEALRVLGYEEAPVRIVGFDDLQARLWRISENLHRNELTALQRAEQIAEYARLMSGQPEDQKEVQVESDDEKEPQAPASESEKVRHGGAVGGRGNEGGHRATARDLGVPEQTIRRATQIAGITPKAKEAALGAGIGDNQSALLKVASYADEDQVEAVAKISKARAERALAPPTQRQTSTGAAAPQPGEHRRRHAGALDQRDDAERPPPRHRRPGTSGRDPESRAAGRAGRLSVPANLTLGTSRSTDQLPKSTRSGRSSQPIQRGIGRVEMWRGDVRLSMSVPAPFVRRCLSASAVAPFPHPAHRSGHADFPHPALGQDFTPSSRATPSAASEHHLELIGCPISMRSASVLN